MSDAHTQEARTNLNGRLPFEILVLGTNTMQGTRRLLLIAGVFAFAGGFGSWLLW